MLNFAFNQRSGFLIASVLLIFLCRGTCGQTVSRLSVYPDFSSSTLRSSVFGGAMIYVRGVGFDATTFQNQIFIDQDVCEINNYFTTETSLACRVPSKYYGNVDDVEKMIVSVYVKGVLAPIISGNRNVKFTSDRTGSIAFLYPQAALPGQELRIYGIHRASTYEDLQRVMIGDQNCELDELVQEEDLNFYSFTTLKCNIPTSLHAGDYLMAIEGDHGTGNMLNPHSAKGFTSDSSYNVRVHPKIDSISVNEGFANGQLLTISGHGFGDSGDGLSIRIQDVDCAPISVTMHSIVCEVAKRDAPFVAQTIYEGGAGLMRQYFEKEWTITQLYTEFESRSVSLNEAHTEHAEGDSEKFAWVSSALSMEEDPEGEWYLIRMLGIFTAPASGSYKFYIASDDMGILKISANEINFDAEYDQGQMETLCEQRFNTSQRNYFLYEDNGNICEKTMIQGKKYFIEYLYRQGTGRDYFTVAMEAPGASASNPNTLAQIQEIRIVNNYKEEIIRVKMCGMESGSYRIVFPYEEADANGQTTIKNDIVSTSISWNSSASALRSSIVPQTGWWFLQVTLGTLDSNGNPTSVGADIECYEYVLTFTDYKTETLQPIVIMDALMPGTATSQVTIVQKPTDPVRGSFTLKYDGIETEEIPYNEWRFGLKYKLEKLEAFKGGVTVYETGSPNLGKTFYVSLDGMKPADIKNFQRGTNNLTGGATGSPGIAFNNNFRLASTQRLFYEPVPSDFLSSFHSTPEVVVTRSGLSSACPNRNCGYTFIADSDSVKVATFTYSQPNIVFDLTGNGTYETLFNDPANFSVTFGDSKCLGVTLTNNILNCRMESDGALIKAGSHRPKVLLKGKGYVIFEGTAFEQEITISSVSPSTVPKTGMLTIQGTNFSPNADEVTVDLGGANCTLLSVSLTEIKCAFSFSSIGSKSVSLTINGKSKTFADDIIVNEAFNMTSVTPNVVSPIVKRTLSVSGSGFGTDFSKVTVKFSPTNANSGLHDLFCYPLSDNFGDGSFDCSFPGGKSGIYDIEVIRDGYGVLPFTSGGGADKLTVGIFFNPVATNSGSVEGGHVIRFSGFGFSSVSNENQVVLGTDNDVCTVTDSGDNFIECITPKPKAPLNTPLDIAILGRITEEAQCNGTCTYTFSDASTPKITNVSSINAKAGDSVTLTGTNLNPLPTQSVEVLVGGVPANVTASDATSVTFEFPALSALDVDFSVSVGGKGVAQQNQNNAKKAFPNEFEVTSVDPVVLIRGGGILTISGNGFLAKDKVSVKIQNRDCYVSEASPNELKCWLISFSGENNSVRVFNHYDSGRVEKVCASCNVQRQGASGPSVDSMTNPNLNDLTSISFTVSGTMLREPNTIVIPYLFAEDQESYPMLKVRGNPSDGTLDNEVDLSFTNMTGGSYTLIYYILDQGFAQRSASVQNIVFTESVETPISTTKYSFAGGATLSITGKGFIDGNDYPGVYRVTVCGREAATQSITFDSMKVTIPLLNSAEIQSDLNLEPVAMLEPVNVFDGNGNELSSELYDGDLVTNYNGSENCVYKMDFGEGFVALVTAFRMFPRLATTEQNLVGGELQGAMTDTGNESDWTTLFTIQNTPDENWNEYHAPEEWKYRYYRFKNTPYCRLAEFHLVGRLYNEFPSINLSSHKCDLQIFKKDDPIFEGTGDIEYSNAVYPEITGISHAYIPSVGAPPITIQGNNLINAISVTIDGIECVIDTTSKTNSSIECQPGNRNEFKTPEFEVITSEGKAVNKSGISPLYADRWSSRATWFNEPLPVEGDFVVVPKGQTLLVDVGTVPRLRSIIVEGILIFEDQAFASPNTFDADYIVVNGGHMQIGTVDQPYESDLVITLYGDRDSQMLPGFGNKAIMVNDGVLDIHGKARNPTWTLLSESPNLATAPKVIKVEGQIDWQPGEKIIIAPTGRNRDEFEVKIIDSVTVDSGQSEIVLKTDLQFAHFSGVITANNKSTEIRGEVGLLTRNVVVQGDSGSAQMEYGSHIMFRGSEDKVRGRLSYFETRLAGQAFQMGRYPIHFHMIGQIYGSYIKGCSIHTTFNRATTIHGVHGLLIEKNVVFNVKGHAIFVEDSIETNNVVRDNFVIYVNASPSLLESDLKVAGIWITHPSNSFTGNHVVGSEFFSFWYDLPQNPTGPSATPNVCPRSEAFGKFENNVGHSSGVGLRIYPFYTPRSNPCEPAFNDGLVDPFSMNEPVVALFKNNVMYMNGQGIFHRDIGAVQHDDLRLFGNTVDMVIASPMWARDSQPQIRNSLFVGHSALNDLHNVPNGHGLHTGRKDGFLLKDSSFVNYTESNLFRTCNGCNNEVHRDIGGRRTTFENVSFINVSNDGIRYNDAEQDKDIFLDKTGSLIQHLTGQSSSGGWITPWNKQFDIQECTRHSDPKVCSPDCAICSLSVDVLRLELTFSTNAALVKGQDVKIFDLTPPNGASFTTSLTDESLFGVSSWRNVKFTENFEGYTINVVSGRTYNLHFGGGIDWSDITIRNNIYWDQNTKNTQLRFNNTSARESYNHQLSEVTLTALNGDGEAPYTVTSLQSTSSALTAANSFGDFYYDSDLLSVKIDGKKRGFVTQTAVLCTQNCGDQGDVPVIEDTIRRWSQNGSWGANGAVPVDGESATIEETWNMVVDVDTAKLDKVTVLGKLSFSDDYANARLNTKVLDIGRYGMMVAGEAGSPLTQEASIMLHGEPTDAPVTVGAGIESITKGIIVRGKLQMFGERKNPVWTKLIASAIAGASILRVDFPGGTTNWKRGDKLVIASSSTDMEQVEVVTVNTANPDGTITISETLSHFHYGSPLTVSAGSDTLDMRAEVGNLTRNIRIEGSPENTFGCTILVPRYQIVLTTDVIQGHLHLDSVQIDRCGQPNTEKAAIQTRFLEEVSGQVNTISHSSVTDSQGQAVNLQNSKKVSFTDNVVYNARRYAIYLEGDSETNIEDNLIVHVRTRNDYNNTEEFDLVSGIYRLNAQPLESPTNTVIRNNRVSSVPWFAFLMSGHDCAMPSTTTPNFSGNVAHSSRVGWFAYDTAGPSCVKFSHFHAYKNFEQGFVNRFNFSNIEVSKMVLADNTNSIAVNGGNATRDSFYSTARTSDLYIFGRALESCAMCYQGEGNCEHNGMYSSLFNESNYTFYFEETRLPMHNSTSSSYNMLGRHYVDNVHFVNFQSSYACDSPSKAFRLNNFYQDGAVAVWMSNVTATNVDEDSKFYFPSMAKHPNTIPFCGRRDCTAQINIPIYDLSGAFYTSEANYIGNNPALSSESSCDFSAVWNGFRCTSDFAQLSFLQSSRDRDPVVSPVTVSVSDYPQGTPPNQIFRHSVDSHFKFAAITKVGREHFLEYSATMPSGILYKLSAPTETDYIIVKLRSENPAPMFLKKQNNRIANGILGANNEYSFEAPFSCGQNFIFRENDQTNTIVFLITAEQDCEITVENNNVIELTAKLAVAVADFYSNDGPTTFVQNMAALLGVSFDRVRIVRVYEGSTIVEFVVTSSLPFVDSDENNNTATAELSIIGDKFLSDAQTSTLNFGGTVEEVTKGKILLFNEEAGDGDGDGDGEGDGEGEGEGEG